MKVEKVKIEDLISPEYNPRKISAEDKEKLKKSLQEFGYVDPIIVNKHNNHIVGGNQRYEVLKELGYDEVEIIYIDEKDPIREKALNIALNKIQGEFDFSKLDLIFEEMKLDDFDITLTGFDEELDIDDSDLDELYTDYDDTPLSNDRSEIEEEWEFNKKIFFTNELDQDLFYKFIDEIKEKYGEETISENLLAYLNDTFKSYSRIIPFQSDFEIIFKTEEEEEEFRDYFIKIRKRYPKVKDPFMQYIKEFYNELQ